MWEFGGVEYAGKGEMVNENNRLLQLISIVIFILLFKFPNRLSWEFYHYLFEGDIKILLIIFEFYFEGFPMV